MKRITLFIVLIALILSACSDASNTYPDSYYKHVDSITVTPERAKQIIDSSLKR